jgi:transcriptional regulator with XRE-family HTH domain
MLTLPRRNRVYDFAGYQTNSTSPGIAAVQSHANRTDAGGGDPAFVDSWEQQRFVFEQAKHLDLIAQGVYQGSGGNFVLVVVKTEARSPEPAEDPALAFSDLEEQIATLKSALSLQVKELAQILGVERPTIYSWINRRNTPRSASREKLFALYRLAQQWNRLSTSPLGSALHEADEAGTTLFHLLRNPTLSTTRARNRLNAIAQARKSAEQQASSKRPNLTLRDLAKKHGIDLDAAADQQDELDLETGKRISPE